jgi:hypothetical protein
MIIKLTMRIICSVTAVFALVQTASAFSPNTGASGGFNLHIDAATLSQKAVLASQMGMTTQRDTIKMPSQTPMVPWTVRKTLCI